MSDEVKPKRKRGEKLTPEEYAKTRRAGGLARSRQRTSEDYREMINKRWREKKGDGKDE